jgi:recombination protein RecA
MEDNRKKALAAALGQIEKQFGKGSVMRLGDAPATYDVEAVSTGSLGLEGSAARYRRPAGPGGGDLGPESSGRPRLPQVIPKCSAPAAPRPSQRRTCARSLRRNSVSTNELLVSQPDTGEQALEIPTCWCAQCGGHRSSTLRPRSRPRPRSRARWARSGRLHAPHVGAA